MTTIKIVASEKMQEDLDELKELLDASSNVEVVRRAVALVVFLQRKLKGAKSIVIEGDNPQGGVIEISLR